MKKVMYLLEYPIDLPGGAQMSTQSLCEGLIAWNAAGHPGGEEIAPVVVCPPLLTKEAGDYSFRVVEYPSLENRENRKSVRVRNLAGRLFWFRRIIGREKPDIVHIQMPESAIVYGLLRGIGFFRGIRFVFTDRGLYYGYRRHSMLLLKHALKYADRLLCTTEYNRKLWQENSRVRHIGIISNTISTAFGAFDADRRKRLRQEQGFSEEDLVLGFAGRMCEEKNWPLAVKLCGELVKRGVRFKAALVLSVFEQGDMEAVGGLLRDLRGLLKDENVWYRQDLSQAGMADYYYLPDVFVMTSRFESFGKAAVEAMSRRCAVVSTNVGGLPEVVGKPENLYSEDEPGKCADYVEKVYHDKVKHVGGENGPEDADLLERDKEFFYRRYRENYAPEKCLEEHIKLYRELTGDRKELKYI